MTSRLALGALCAIAAAACTDPRARPVPPEVVIQFPSASATSPDTISGSLYAFDSDGLRDLLLILRSADGAFTLDTALFIAGTNELNRNLLFHIPAGRGAGSQMQVIARVLDETGFATSDTTFITIQ